MKHKLIISNAFKRVGLSISAILFLFWGAFFLSHLFEWFLNTAKGLPPVSVWINMFFNLLMLIGLAMTIKWHKIGVIITLFGTIAFFTSIGYGGFPYIALLNVIPLFFLGMHRMLFSSKRVPDNGSVNIDNKDF